MPTRRSTNLLKIIKKNQRTQKVKKLEQPKQQKNRKQQKTEQQGGKSPSCLVKPDVSKYVKNSCHTANLHNTNPEVDYTLITDTGMSGGACPPNVKPMTFKTYLQDVAGKLGGDVDSVSKGDLEQQMAGADGHPSGVQTGAGFSTNPEQQIAGMPVYDKYDDCCQPALVSGKLVEGGKAGAICGNQMGGKNKKLKTQKRNNSKKSKSSNKSKRNNNKSKTQKRNNKEVKCCKCHKVINGNKLQSVRKWGHCSYDGNDCCPRSKYKLKGGSRPADFPNESHSGLNSDFDPMGKGKNFEGKQPFWGAKTR